jgi:plasmid stabilization system protein ParE
MSRWQLTPEAEDDIFDIWSYVARDNSTAASDVEQAIYLACDLLSESPLA